MRYIVKLSIMALVIVVRQRTCSTCSEALTQVRVERCSRLRPRRSVDLGSVHGFRTRFHLYTVPGQILYERTRLAVLNGADGIVFVADSQAEKFEENVQSISELEMNMRRIGK